jgi:hypothetical protein
VGDDEVVALGGVVADGGVGVLRDEGVVVTDTSTLPRSVAIRLTASTMLCVNARSLAALGATMATRSVLSFAGRASLPAGTMTWNSTRRSRLASRGAPDAVSSPLASVCSWASGTPCETR